MDCAAGSRELTPGGCVSDLPFAVSSAIRVSLHKEFRHIGFALLNEDLFQLQLCEFRDDSSYTFLESALLQCQPHRCAINMQGCYPSEEKKIRRVLERCKVEQTQDTFHDANIQQFNEQRSFAMLLRPDEQGQQHYKGIQEMASAKIATHYLIKQSRLLDDPSRLGQYSLRVFAPDSYMRLDQATFSALHIFPEKQQQRATPGNSLYGFLNKCRTTMGKQRLKTWIVQPSLDLQEIRQRQDVVELFLRYPHLRQILTRDHLRHLPPLDSLISKFHRALLHPKATACCSLQDVLHFHQSLAELHGVVAVLNTLKEQESGPMFDPVQHLFLDPLLTSLKRLQRFHDLVEYTFDPEERKSGRALIHRQFDPTLAELTDKKDHYLAEIEQHRRAVEQSLPLLRPTRKAADPQLVKIVECSSHGFVFRVTKKDQPIVQRDKQRFKLVRINKAEFQFTTKELMRLSESYREALAALEVQQHDLSLKTILAAASYWPVMESLANVIGQLDILLSFAEVVATTPSRFCRPTLYPLDNERQFIHLHEARHPLLEVQHHIQHAESSGKDLSFSIVPNSVLLEKPDCHVHLITGPNMGGKSTYIRQIGLICLMAQLGCYVPCTSAELSLIDAILCRVGASDDQLRGISTFYAEMIETAAILKASTHYSLILMDELGRGTSTSEGLALAIEVTRYIATELNSFCLFATHFQELQQLEMSVKGVQCYHVDVHATSTHLKFLYRVLPGCADHSYGIHVAEMARMEPAVVQRARHVSDTLERCDQQSRHTSVIQSLYASIAQILQHSLPPSPISKPDSTKLSFTPSFDNGTNLHSDFQTLIHNAEAALAQLKSTS